MEITHDKGIVLSNEGKHIVLDPSKKTAGGIVSHGHMDHLVPGALMTPETKDILEVRTGSHEASLLDLDSDKEWYGFDVHFHSAGHVLGSIMVETENILYTGDFNPEGGFFTPPPPNPSVDTLITEATYGGRNFKFPPKTRVLEDLKSWVEAMSGEGPVIIGAYEFGKAQEVMNIGRLLKLETWVPKRVGELTDVYNKYGAGLDYHILGEELPLDPGILAVVPNHWLKHPKEGRDRTGYDIVKALRGAGGASAFVSGWCVVYKYFRSMLIDAQFPLSDHADHEHLIQYVEDSGARDVLVVHSGKDTGKKFVAELEEKVGCRARMLK